MLMHYNSKNLENTILQATGIDYYYFSFVTTPYLTLQNKDKLPLWRQHKSQNPSIFQLAANWIWSNDSPKQFFHFKGISTIQGHGQHSTIKWKLLSEAKTTERARRENRKDTVTKWERCRGEKGHYLGIGDRTNDMERKIGSLIHTHLCKHAGTHRRDH